MADRSDELARREKQRLGQITDAFVDGLATVVGDTPVVVFIDDCHKMTTETEIWLRAELLLAIGDDKLRNMYLVLFSQKDDTFDSWSGLVQQAQLKPFTRNDIAVYLEKRGVEVNSDLTGVLSRYTKGRVSQVQLEVDRIIEERRRGV